MGLPRSRAAWLANWFTIGESFCVHDAWRYADNTEELKEYLLENAPEGCKYVGTSGSGNGATYHELKAAFPDAAFAVVDRPLNDAIEATSKLSIVTSKDEIITRLAELNLVHHYLPESVHRTRYKDLDDLLEMGRLHKFLTPDVSFNFVRYRMLSQLRVTIHEEKYMVELTTNKAGY